MSIRVTIDKVEAVEDGKDDIFTPVAPARLTPAEKMLLRLWLASVGWKIQGDGS